MFRRYLSVLLVFAFLLVMVPVHAEEGVAAPLAPHIRSQPKDISVVPNHAFELVVNARSPDGGTLTYQWYHIEEGVFAPIEGAIYTSYSGKHETPGQYAYYCKVTNTVNGQSASVDSNTVIVTVTGKPRAPIITAQPMDVLTKSGQITVGAKSPDGGELTYRWFTSLTNKDYKPFEIYGIINGKHYAEAMKYPSFPCGRGIGIVYYYCVVTNTINGISNSRETRVCTVAGFNCKEAEHVWGEWEELAPTCDCAGARWRVCSKCDARESKNIPRTKEHTWGDFRILPEQNLREHTCTLCGEIETSAIPTSTPRPFTFIDVPAKSWYYRNVKTACEEGLVSGVTATAFRPEKNLTGAEAIKLAACLRERYGAGEVTLQNGTPWYQTYVDYLTARDISTEGIVLDAAIPRAAFADFFARAFPKEGLAPRNEIEWGQIPDVNLDAPYAEGVYTLYRVGILTGSDAHGNFHPQSFITRAEVAVILTRMMHPEERKEFTLS